jgi:hypothetical protein
MSNKEVASVVGLSQSTVNRIRKKHFENIIMPRRGCPQALTTWKKQYATCLNRVGGSNIVVDAIRELNSASRINVCVETVKNGLRRTCLGSIEKVSKPALSA